MTYDSTRGNASLRHEINNSLTLISSRLQLLAARYDFLKEDSDFTEIQNDLSDIQRLLNYDRTARALYILFARSARTAYCLISSHCSQSACHTG